MELNLTVVQSRFFVNKYGDNIKLKNLGITTCCDSPRHEIIDRQLKIDCLVIDNNNFVETCL